MLTSIHLPILTTVSLIFASLRTETMYCAITLKHMLVPASLPMSGFIPGGKIQRVVSEFKEKLLFTNDENMSKSRKSHVCLYQVHNHIIDV